MFLGFSYGEIIVTAGVLTILIGPKELPIIARMAGRVTGQAAAFLSRSRTQWQKFAEENEIAQLHREMQESLGQLRAIQNELRYGPHFMSPGPLAQRALRLPQQKVDDQGSAPDQAAVPTRMNAETNRGAAAGALNRLAAEEPDLAQRLAAIDPQLLQALQDHLTKGTPPGRPAPLHNSCGSRADRRPEGASHREQLSSGESGSGRSEMEGSMAVVGPRGGDGMGRGVTASGGISVSGLEGDVRWRGYEGFGPGSKADGGVLNALPVSAVAMGLAPQRSGEGTPSGADIAMDALAEEEVARMAQRFFQQQEKKQQQPQPPGT